MSKPTSDINLKLPSGCWAFPAAILVALIVVVGFGGGPALLDFTSMIFWAIMKFFGWSVLALIGLSLLVVICAGLFAYFINRKDRRLKAAAEALWKQRREHQQRPK